MTIINLFCLLLVGAFLGCTVYQEKPLVMTSPQPLSAPLRDDASVRRAVLIRDDGLNQLLCELKSSRAIESATGYWADPSLSLDLLRNQTSGRFLGGVGLGFELPLNGLPATEVEAARRAIRTLEARYRAQALETLLAVDQALSTLNHAQARDELLANQHHRMLSHVQRYRQLCDVGEGSVDQLRAYQSIAAELALAQREAARAVLDAQAQIAQRLRVKQADLALAARYAHASSNKHQATGNKHSSSRLDPAAQPPPNPNSQILLRERPLLTAQSTQPFAGIAHPQIVVEWARYAQAEIALEQAIRQQYPTLTLGPAIGREEGNNRVGFGAGINIPLWNRNRQAIAQQTAQRAAVADQAVRNYHAFVVAFDQAKLAVDQGHIQLKQASQAEALAQRTLEQTRDLVNHGERPYTALVDAERAVDSASLTSLTQQSSLDQAILAYNYFTQSTAPAAPMGSQARPQQATSSKQQTNLSIQGAE